MTAVFLLHSLCLYESNLFKSLDIPNDAVSLDSGERSKDYFECHDLLRIYCEAGSGTNQWMLVVQVLKTSKSIQANEN
jgi:hypothetical protein